MIGGDDLLSAQLPEDRGGATGSSPHLMNVQHVGRASGCRQAAGDGLCRMTATSVEGLENYNLEPIAFAICRRFAPERDKPAVDVRRERPCELEGIPLSASKETVASE